MSYWWVIPIASVLTYLGLRVSDKLVDRSVRRLIKKHGDAPKDFLRETFARYEAWQELREGVEGESKWKTFWRVTRHFVPLAFLVILIVQGINTHIAIQEFVPLEQGEGELIMYSDPPEHEPWSTYSMGLSFFVIIFFYDLGRRAKGKFARWCLMEISGIITVEQLDSLFSVDTEWHEKNAGLMSDGDLVGDERTDTSANSDLTERSGEKL